jgi:hypothetical protein
MAYLLRKLRNKDAWAAAEDSPLWATEGCPPDVLVEVFDKNGVSMWRVNTAEEVRRVIAAQALLGKSIPADFAYFLVEEEDLHQAKLTLKNSTAKTPDIFVNNLHVDVIQLSGQKLICFARLLKTKLNQSQSGGDDLAPGVWVMTRTEILEMAAKCFGEGKFDRSFLFSPSGKRGRSEDEIAASKTLLVDLWKKALIDIVSPPA